MSQRNGLLNLYANLGTDRETRNVRRAVYIDLQQRASTDKAGRTARTIRQDPLPVDGAEAANVLLASTTELATSADDEVLDVEIAEALLAVADRFVFDSADAFATDPALGPLAGRLVSDRNQIDDVLRLIHAVAADEAYQQLRPRTVSPSSAAENLTTTAGARTSVDLLRARNADLAQPLQLTFENQPGSRCRSRLVPVDLDGRGEYAVSLRTDVWFDRARVPATFVDELFDPTTWPERHSFWCSMTPAPACQAGSEAQRLMAEMASVESIGVAAGVQYGQVLTTQRVFDEQVGDCPAGSYPNTILLFTDSRVLANGSPTPPGQLPEGTYCLEYRLVPGWSELLELDDGTIQVHVAGEDVQITITKILFFTETDHTSQVEAMAEYACVSGWAEQTRQFLLGSHST